MLYSAIYMTNPAHHPIKGNPDKRSSGQSSTHNASKILPLLYRENDPQIRNSNSEMCPILFDPLHSEGLRRME